MLEREALPLPCWLPAGSVAVLLYLRSFGLLPNRLHDKTRRRPIAICNSFGEPENCLAALDVVAITASSPDRKTHFVRISRIVITLAHFSSDLLIDCNPLGCGACAIGAA